MQFGEKNLGGAHASFFEKGGGGISKGGHVSSFERGGGGGIGMAGPLAWGGGPLVLGSSLQLAIAWWAL